jgi:uncharacterized protein (DUF885 family)
MPMMSTFTSDGTTSGALPQATEATRALHTLLASEWDYVLEQSPIFASQLGDRRWNDRWDDVSLAAFDARYAHAKAALGRLAQIDRTQLSPGDQINSALFEFETRLSIEEHGHRWWTVPVSQLAGVQLADELADALRFETVKDYEDWIARCRVLPAYVDQTIALMREGIRERRVQSKVTMRRVPAQIDQQITATPEASPFFKPFLSFPAQITAPDKQRLTGAAAEAIRTHVIPAYRRFSNFFSREYLAACFDQVGTWQVPGGDALYAFLVRKFTTTKLTPGEVHEIGQGEVARIEREMQAVMDKAGFKGTRQEFFQFLRNDPRFYCHTPEELLATYRAVAKRVDPALVKVFKTLPRMPYGVDPIPEKIAPDTTAAYYRQPAADGSRAGTYFVNLYRPEMRPKWEMMALSLHEAVPGHHLQFALAYEQDDLPAFRRYGGERAYVAYIEGWALYAEALGEELGLYDDPYSKFGQLTYEMWRAVRLVLDTGIHALRWTRQQAIDYFLAHAPKTELDVINEVDRYIAWPGQSLAYKIGELKIKELRARAARELGAQFDLREFHELVLRLGAVPLHILEREVNTWIASQRQCQFPPCV